jgi:multimeric flavodoxin WrbA
MKITTVLGSPRKRGNTASILRCFEELAAPYAQMQRINIVEYEVRGCLGCDACQKKPGIPGCIQKDDALDILETLLASDIIIYASPVYVWDFTAQMKALMDRQYCLVKWHKGSAHSLMEGKLTALLTTCGGGREENADLIQQVFQREMDYARCRVIGMYAVGDCSLPSRLGPKKEDTARQMLKDVMAAVSLPGSP